MSELTYQEKPELIQPAMIMAFSGWPNAGEVSTGTMNYLFSRLSPMPLASIDPDPFHDFTENRPTALIESGRLMQLASPTHVFSYVKGSEGEGDLILFKGSEPNLRWNLYCDQIERLVREMQVQMVISLGGTYDYVPHWASPRISAVYSGEKAEHLTFILKDRLQFTQYQGPVSIHTMIQERVRSLGLPAISLWGHAPVYIQTGNVKIHHLLVELLKKLLGFSLDTTEMLADIEAMDRQIDDLVAKNPKLKKYLEELNQEYQESRRRPGPPRSQPEGQTGKVISLEEFLKRTEE